jgi:hypothetical protein
MKHATSNRQAACGRRVHNDRIVCARSAKECNTAADVRVDGQSLQLDGIDATPAIGGKIAGNIDIVDVNHVSSVIGCNNDIGDAGECAVLGRHRNSAVHFECLIDTCDRHLDIARCSISMDGDIVRAGIAIDVERSRHEGRRNIRANRVRSSNPSNP